MEKKTTYKGKNIWRKAGMTSYQVRGYRESTTYTVYELDGNTARVFYKLADARNFIDTMLAEVA